MVNKKSSKTLTIRKVLFVCNGNLYRSFSAEVLLKHYLDKHKIKGWEVFSAGTRAKKHVVHEEVLARLHKFGIKDLNHTQHKLDKEMLKKYDLVIAMAEDQVHFMKKNFNYEHAVLFNELIRDESISIWDVEDNVHDYMTNEKGVWQEIDRTIKYLHDSMPKLVENINQRVYLFEDFARGMKKRDHRNGFPMIKLYETPNTLAFMSISIPSKEDGHILVIPKKRYIFFHEIPAKILDELLRAVKKISEVVEKDHGGYNILLNNGRVAGQFIFHAHFHIFSRDLNDKIDLRAWSTKRITKEQFVELNKKLKDKINKSV